MAEKKKEEGAASAAPSPEAKIEAKPEPKIQETKDSLELARDRMFRVREVATEAAMLQARMDGIFRETRGLFVDGEPEEARKREKPAAEVLEKIAGCGKLAEKLMAGAGEDEANAHRAADECQARLDAARATHAELVKMLATGVPKQHPPEYVPPKPRPNDPTRDDVLIVYLDSHEGDEIKLTDACSVYGNRKARLSHDEARRLAQRVKHMVKIPPVLLGGQHVILATSKEVEILPQDTLGRVAEAHADARG